MKNHTNATMRITNMSTVTKEKVFAACEKIEENNEKLTQSAVRKILNGGSFTDISPLFNEYKERKAEAEGLQDEPLPADMLEEVQLAAKIIFKRAKENAEVEANALREKLKEVQQQLSEQEAEHAKQIEMIEADNERAAAKAADELKAAQDSSAKFENDAKEANEKLRDLEKEVIRLEAKTDTGEIKSLIKSIIDEVKSDGK